MHPSEGKQNSDNTFLSTLTIDTDGKLSWLKPNLRNQLQLVMQAAIILN